MFLGFVLCNYLSCQAAEQQTIVKPRCQVQQPSSNCSASTLSNCQAVHLLLAHLVVLVIRHPSNIHKHVGPLLGRSTDPIQTTTRSDPNHNQLRVKTCDCLDSFLSSNFWFAIHELWNSYQRYQECLQSSGIRSVNAIAGIAGIDLSTFFM